jgi:hypothetical protein
LVVLIVAAAAVLVTALVVAAVVFSKDHEASGSAAATVSFSDEGMSAAEFHEWFVEERPEDAAADCDHVAELSDDGWTRDEIVDDYVAWIKEPPTAEEEAEFAEEQADVPVIDPDVTERQFAEEMIDYCLGGA